MGKKTIILNFPKGNSPAVSKKQYLTTKARNFTPKFIYWYLHIISSPSISRLWHGMDWHIYSGIILTHHQVHALAETVGSPSVDRLWYWMCLYQHKVNNHVLKVPTIKHRMTTANTDGVYDEQLLVYLYECDVICIMPTGIVCSTQNIFTYIITSDTSVYRYNLFRPYLTSPCLYTNYII